MADETKNDTLKENVDKHAEALDRVADTVTCYTLWALGAGFIPFKPLASATVAGLQLRMLMRLAEHYGADYCRNRARFILAALLGMVTVDGLNKGSFTKIIRALPVVGRLGALTAPIYSAAVTYAVGKIFVLHFESGGTLLNFNLEDIKNDFNRFFEEGRAKVAEMKK